MPRSSFGALLFIDGKLPQDHVFLALLYSRQKGRHITAFFVSSLYCLPSTVTERPVVVDNAYAS